MLVLSSALVNIKEIVKMVSMSLWGYTRNKVILEKTSLEAVNYYHCRNMIFFFPVKLVGDARISALDAVILCPWDVQITLYFMGLNPSLKASPTETEADFSNIF